MAIDPAFADIFPLPLTTFESLMLLDSRPDYPMMVDLEMRFDGAIDRQAFDAGLRFAIGRNPLMTSLVRREGKKKIPCWQPSEQLPQVDWAPLGTPIGDSYGQHVDLTSEVGLKIWVRQGSEQSTVLLHFHHAISDGLGCHAFMDDLLVGYNAALPGAMPVSPRPWEPARLPGRGLIGVLGRPLLRRIYDSIVGVREVIRFFVLPRCRCRSRLSRLMRLARFP